MSAVKILAGCKTSLIGFGSPGVSSHEFTATVQQWGMCAAREGAGVAELMVGGGGAAAT